MFVNVPSLRRPDDGARRAGTCFSLEVLLTPVRATGRLGGVDRAAAWLELVAGLLRERLPRLDRGRRVMTPDVYEREFHLPPATPPASPAARSPPCATTTRS